MATPVGNSLADENGLLPWEFAYWGPEGKGYYDARGNLHIVAGEPEDCLPVEVKLPYGAPKQDWVDK